MKEAIPMDENNSVINRIKDVKPHFITTIFLVIALLFLLPIILTSYLIITDKSGIDELAWLIVSAISAAILMLFTFIGMLITFVTWIKKRDRKIAEYLFLINLVLFLTPVGIVYGFFQYQEYKRVADANRYYETLNLDQKLAYQLNHWGNDYSKLPFGDEKDIQRLIREGANIDALNEQGLSPLCFAVTQGYRQSLVKFILDIGANRYQVCRDGEMAVHLAAKYCSEASMNILVEYLNDLSVVSKNNDTPFDLLLANATRNPHNCIGTALVLKDHGVDITQQDADGNTLLHLTAVNTSKYYVQRLIEAGLSARIKNKQGLTASMVAKQHFEKNKYSHDHPLIEYLEQQEKIQEQ